jgi:hypothetical protein
MKTITKYLLVAAASLFASCAVHHSDIDTDLVIVLDRTDKLSLYPTAEAITSQLGLPNNPWQGIRIRVTYISDKDLNQTTVVELAKENEWTGNKEIRAATIAHFKIQLVKCFAAMRPIATLPRSIIYRAVIKQANNLAASTAQNKYLLVYSNLVENSEVSFYDRRTVDALRRYPSIIQKQLDKDASIATLRGVNIWLLYDPVSYADNNNYMFITAFYQHVFEARKATVKVANQFLVR